MASGQVRDAPLLQVSSAQLSRSSSQAAASSRAAPDGLSANAGLSGLTAEPTLANFASSGTTDHHTDLDAQQSSEAQPAEEGDLLAAVNAAIGGLGFGGLPDEGIASASANAASANQGMQDVFGATASGGDGLTGAAAAPAADMFFSMPVAAPARTRSSFRTGSLLGGFIAGGADAAALSNPLAGQQPDLEASGSSQAVSAFDSSANPHQVCH